MIKARDIFITSESGMENESRIAFNGISEIMSCFPEYKDAYPITVLGNWKNQNADYISNGRQILRSYESIDWYIARAIQKSKQQGRWNDFSKQLSIDQLVMDLASDPYRDKIPQFSLLLVNHDLYAENTNFCLGIGYENLFCIISTARLRDRNGNLKTEEFKTIVMHEFGHVLGLTESNRENIEENLGPHCLDSNCIMRQRANGDFSDVTMDRLQAKRNGNLPICIDCRVSGYINLEKDYTAQLEKYQQKLRQLQSINIQRH